VGFQGFHGGGGEEGPAGGGEMVGGIKDSLLQTNNTSAGCANSAFE
jgi:hypothetical protein